MVSERRFVSLNFRLVIVFLFFLFGSICLSFLGSALLVFLFYRFICSLLSLYNFFLVYCYVDMIVLFSYACSDNHLNHLFAISCFPMFYEIDYIFLLLTLSFVTLSLLIHFFLSFSSPLFASSSLPNCLSLLSLNSLVPHHPSFFHHPPLSFLSSYSSSIPVCLSSPFLLPFLLYFTFLPSLSSASHTHSPLTPPPSPLSAPLSFTFH